MVHKCDVLCCESTTSRRKKFPNPLNDRNRYLLWLSKTGNSALLELSDLKVWDTKRICDSHFSVTKDFVEDPDRWLNKNIAIPDVSLPEPLLLPGLGEIDDIPEIETFKTPSILRALLVLHETSKWLKSRKRSKASPIIFSKIKTHLNESPPTPTGLVLEMDEEINNQLKSTKTQEQKSATSLTESDVNDTSLTLKSKASTPIVLKNWDHKVEKRKYSNDDTASTLNKRRNCMNWKLFGSPTHVTDEDETLLETDSDVESSIYSSDFETSSESDLSCSSSKIFRNNFSVSVGKKAIASSMERENR